MKAQPCAAQVITRFPSVIRLLGSGSPVLALPVALSASDGCMSSAADGMV